MDHDLEEPPFRQDLRALPFDGHHRVFPQLSHLCQSLLEGLGLLTLLGHVGHSSISDPRMSCLHWSPIWLGAPESKYQGKTFSILA